MMPNAARTKIAQGASLPAPVGGWDAVSSLADMPEDRAVTLDNWFPRPDSVEIRKGYKNHATGMGSTVVETLLVYHGLTAAAGKMFAALGGDFYDVTAEATASATSSVTGMANNRWQWVNFTTAGGKFLWACNGADTPKHYDGSAWATPSISGITSSDIVHVNAHQNRLWFVLKDSTKAAYLATGAVAGTATAFELGGECIRGGFLTAMGTWTRDGGSGMDDLAVFIFSTGDCIIYQGTDPASSNTWAKIGTYQLAPPIGRRCFNALAGDLVITSIEGVLPISKALQVDQSALATIAFTKNINNAFNAVARSYKSNFGWEVVPYARGTMALINVPIAEGSLQHQYVFNTLTGAPCRFTGWNVNTMVVFNDNLYGGTNDGKVIRLDFGGRDGTSEISAIGQAAYHYYKSRGVLKNFGHLRALVTTASDLRPSLGLSTDFKDNAVVGTPVTATIQSALYDSAIYDTDIYAIEGRNVADWSAALGEGHCASIHFRASTNAAGEVSTRINGFDVTYTKGDFI